MNLEARLDLLATTRLFGVLPRETLHAVAEETEVQTLRPGEDLCREGDPSHFVFVVASGVLEVFKQAEEGNTYLHDLGAGEVGGITSMTMVKARSATLRAKSDAIVLTIAKPRFVALLRTHGAIGHALIDVLSEKVRGKTSQVAHLVESQRKTTKKLVAVFDAKPHDRQALNAVGDETVNFAFFEARLNPQTADLAVGYRVVCPFVNDDVGAETVARLAAAGVELIAMRCAGYNNVDLKAATAFGIRVVRVPAYSPYAVAEHAAALLLTLNRKIHRAYHRVREGNFSLNGLVGVDLHGRTAGLVGLGKIGRCFCDIVRGLGMRVLAYDAFPDHAYAKSVGIEMTSLDEVLHRSDVVSLHTPLTPETYHLINAARLQTMKRGVIILNTSRGALVDASALIDALKTGHIGGAGLDVYEEESEYFFEDRSDSIITDDLLARLMTFNNVVITSHQAFLTEEALHNIAETTKSSVLEHLQGKTLTNLVSPPPASAA